VAALCNLGAAILQTSLQDVKVHIIDSKLLYVLYYDEVTGYLSEKLRFLIRWCGTGLDLAADYDSYELARIVTALIDLPKELDAIHKEHGADLCGEGHQAALAYLEERTKDFLSDLGRFSVVSDNYVDNYIEVTEK
jgi:hypothetical protein